MNQNQPLKTLTSYVNIFTAFKFHEFLYYAFHSYEESYN